MFNMNYITCIDDNDDDDEVLEFFLVLRSVTRCENNSMYICVGLYKHNVRTSNVVNA